MDTREIIDVVNRDQNNNGKRDENDKKYQQQFETAFKQEAEDGELKGFMYDFWFIRDVMGFIKREKRLVFASSNAAYSVLSFVMGISSNIDPFYHGYFPEMFYGIRRNRRPFIPLVIPYDMDKKIVKYLENLYGKNNVEHDTCTYVVTIYNEKEKVYQFYLYLLKDYTLSFAEKMMKEELAGDNAENNAEKYLFGRIDRNYSVCEDEQALLSSREIKEVIIDYLDLCSSLDESIKDNSNRFVEETMNGTFAGLVNVIAATKGHNIWDGTERSAAANGIFTRDDVFNCSMEITHDKEDAFSIMEDVRKGRGMSKWKKYFAMGRKSASLSTYRALDSIRYNLSEKAVLPYAQILIYLADAKKRNASLYQSLFKEVMEEKRSSEKTI